MSQERGGKIVFVQNVTTWAGRGSWQWLRVSLVGGAPDSTSDIENG